MTLFFTPDVLSIISFILALLFVSTILRSQRPAGSIMAWLIVVCLVPFVGIPLYLFFSTRKFKTRVAKKQKIYVPIPKEKYLPDSTATQKILAASGSPLPKSNSFMQLLPTGTNAYDRLIELILGAKKTIYISTFIFGNDPVGKSVVTELTKKAAAGVDVRILIDSLGAFLLKHPSFKEFKNVGGRVAYFMPLFHIPFEGRANLRNHRKLMIVDGLSAVIGGMNLAQEYLGPNEDPKRWIDLALELEGNSVQDLDTIFCRDWEFATQDPKSIELKQNTSPATSNDEKFTAQVVASGPDVEDDPLYNVILTQIYKAQKRIRIVTPYFIPDESLATALELAAKRGVDVELIIPLRSNHHLADLARGSFIRQIEAAGAKIGYHPKMIHAKSFEFDNELAVLGSANFDMRSLLLNFEIGLLVYSNEVLKQVKDWADEKQKECSFLKSKAGFWREMAEGMGRVIGPVL